MTRLLSANGRGLILRGGIKRNAGPSRKLRRHKVFTPTTPCTQLNFCNVLKTARKRITKHIWFHCCFMDPITRRETTVWAGEDGGKPRVQRTDFIISLQARQTRSTQLRQGWMMACSVGCNISFHKSRWHVQAVEVKKVCLGKSVVLLFLPEVECN